MPSCYRHWQVHRHYRRRLPRLHQKALDRLQAPPSLKIEKIESSLLGSLVGSFLGSLLLRLVDFLLARILSSPLVQTSNRVVALLPASRRARS